MIPALALHAIHRRPDPKGKVVEVPAGAVFDARPDEFARLEKLGAVRKASRADKAAVEDQADLFNGADPSRFDHDGDGRPGGSAPAPESGDDQPATLSPKHVGGGRWVVVNDAGETVSGDERFADKAAAEAWIAGRSSDESLVG